jgi:hypothetical protein
MGGSRWLHKDTDYETAFWCVGGSGILREEVWANEREEVVRYNLAFLLLHLFYRDNAECLVLTTPMEYMSAILWAMLRRLNSQATKRQQKAFTEK